jgi:hypothetical protein
LSSASRSDATAELRGNLDALMSEHFEDRAEAMEWLARHPVEARPPLHELVRRGRGGARAALEVLARGGDAADVPVMAEALHASRTGWEAAKALAAHRSAAARAALLDACGAPDGEVAGAAAVALGEAGEEAARAAIEKLLRRDDEGVRYRAVLALELLGAAASREALERASETEASADVRASIERVLGAAP